MKPNEVPRYGKHDGIKYSSYRTIFRWCVICGTPIFIQGRGRKPTICSDSCKTIKQQHILEERDPKQHAANERIRYQHLPIEQRKTGKKQKGNYKRRDNYEDELREIQRMKKQLGL